MKRISMILILCLVFVFSITGCDKKETNSETSPTVTDVLTETPAPTEEEKPTEAVTKAPVENEEPTEAVTATPEPTDTEEPTPTSDPVNNAETGAFADEDMEYDIPELLKIGLTDYTDAVYDAEYNKKVDMLYTKILLSDIEKEMYPALAGTVDLINTTNKEVTTSAFEEYRGYVMDGETNLGTFYKHTKGDIVRADSTVLSIKYEESSYSGEPHPYTGISGASFESVSGKKLVISDVCNDCDSLGSMLAYRLEGKYGYWDGEEDFEALVKTIEEKVKDNTISFTIGYDGVTFYFVPYEIGPYALGNMTVTLSFYEGFPAETANGPRMVGLFKKIYRTVSESYMISYTLGDTVELPDLDETTENYDTLYIHGSEYLEYGMKGLVIEVNGKPVFEDNEFSFSQDEVYLYLAKVNDQRFLIFNEYYDGEDPITWVFQFKDGTLVKNDYTSLTPAIMRDYYGENSWDFNIAYTIIDNPLSLTLESRNDVVGTDFQTALYELTEDGNFRMLSKYYDFSPRKEVILKKPFKAGMIDPSILFSSDSEISGEFDIEVELNPGDKIYFEKTDGDRQVFFSTENGEWGTFVMDEDSFGTINGEICTDIFEGVGFAD